MPRTLTLNLNGKEFKASLKVFSRDTTYGKISVERRDKEGNSYGYAYLTSDGSHIIPSGGIGSDYLDEDGNLLKETRLIGSDGENLPITKSMYDEPVNLSNTISLQDYFCYDIERTYILEMEDVKDLIKECKVLLEKNKLMKFTYAYYATHDPKDAILIPKDNSIIVVVGKYEEPIHVKPKQTLFYEDEDEEEPEFDVW